MPGPEPLKTDTVIAKSARYRTPWPAVTEPHTHCAGSRESTQLQEVALAARREQVFPGQLSADVLVSCLTRGTRGILGRGAPHRLNWVSSTLLLMLWIRFKFSEDHAFSSEIKILLLVSGRGLGNRQCALMSRV